MEMYEEEFELLKIWLDRYIMFINCKDQIKYTNFTFKNVSYMSNINSFDQLKNRYKSLKEK